MTELKKSRKLLMFILFGTMFIFGILENIKGVSYPLIKNEFNVSYESLGTMILILSISYTLFVIVSGILLGRMGTKKVYLMGFVCMLLALFSINLMPGFWTVTYSLIVLFAGFGILEIAVNGMATQIFTKKSALMMNLLHFMYGAGSIVGPKAAGMLANPAGPGIAWRQIYLLTIPLVLIIFIFSLYAKFPASLKNINSENITRDSKKSFITALKTPAVWVFGITLGVMVGLELASPTWGGLYFQDLYGMDPTTSGANFVSAFFVLFTISRLVSGFLIEKIGYLKSLFGAALSMMVLFSVGFALGPSGIYVLPLLGFFSAILWPTILAVAIGHFGSDAPVMTGAIIAIAGLLNAGIQFIIGCINLWVGTGWGYRSCLLLNLVLIFLLMGFNRWLKEH